MIKRIKGDEQTCIMPVVEQLVNALSQRQYALFSSLVDHMGTYTVDLLEEVVENSIIAEVGKIDAFGVPCNFSPNYVYKQWQFYYLNDGSGMHFDYALTTDGELNDWTLQLLFRFEQEQIAVVFEDLHIL